MQSRTNPSLHIIVVNRQESIVRGRYVRGLFGSVYGTWFLLFRSNPATPINVIINYGAAGITDREYSGFNTVETSQGSLE